MSVHVSSACKRLDYKGAKREVLLEFADHANDDGICWPSRGRIMYNTGLSEAAVKQQTKELREAGVLVVMDQHEGGRGRVPIYKVCPEKGPQKIPFSEWCEQREKGSKGPGGSQERGQEVAPEPSVKNRQVNEVESKASTSAAGHASRPVPMGQYGMKELAERTKAKRESGASIHSTTDRERKDFGAQFKRAAQDGHELDHMLFALDYMVAKAAGEIDGEPKAWCGYRTALDRVTEGWRPKPALRAVKNPEHERMVAENQRLERELLEGIV